MPNDLKILVKLTLSDFRAFTFAKAYSSNTNKILLSLLLIMFLLIIFAFGIGSFFGDSVDIMILSLFAFMIILLLPGIQYFIIRHNFHKSKLLSGLKRYEFLNEGIHMSSSTGTWALKWADVFKVEELKPCFLIYQSPYKYYLIPRRCIGSQEELTLLRQIIAQHMDRKKLTLKKYPLGKIAVDTGDIIIPAPVTREIENLGGAPFMEFHYLFTKREQLHINLQLYYTSPVGLGFTLLALALIGINLIGTFTNGNYYPFLLLFGVISLIMLPLTIYTNVTRQFKHDAAFKWKYSYQLYEDYFLLHHLSSQNRIQWGDLVKIKQVGAGILLFITTGLVYFIPKRIFAENPAEYEKLWQFIQSKISKKPG